MARSRPVRKLVFRVFQHATEDPPKVLAALQMVSGSTKTAQTRADGYYGNRILIIESEICTRKEIDELWDRVNRAGLCPGIAGNLEERINDSGELFIRFDKQKAVEGGLALSTREDVISARGRVMCENRGQTRRASRMEAVEEMRHFLDGLAGRNPDGVPSDGNAGPEEDAREMAVSDEQRDCPEPEMPQTRSGADDTPPPENGDGSPDGNDEEPGGESGADRETFPRKDDD